ncbi:MAG: reverse transcriptase family protein [Bacteroidota bacterium]
MPETITIKGMKARAERFIQCRDFDRLARLLRKEPLELLNLAHDPQYRYFSIPKKNGGMRQLEDPVPRLKKVQRKLNDYLQAVYHFHRTDAAYGFLTNPKDDPAPRNILTNAQRHIGCNWMLNIDMENFFHQIDQTRIQQLFEAPLLNFNSKQAETLAALCTNRGRLPMGAPTSPILSNLACIPLDHDLQNLAKENGMIYTRYADDLTFSAQTEINQQHLHDINGWVEAYDLKLNPNKIRWYGPNDKDKEVTGVLVGKEEVSLPESYMESLQKAIEKLDDVINAKHATASGRAYKTPWVTELKQQVRGKLEFARHILPEYNDRLIDCEMAYDSAVDPPEIYGPLNWLDFGYTLFKYDSL